ncbi:DUF5801 repeats-in-toxin domain-containing protein [Sphingomonas sp. LHG3406-1]|uniref:beta strand repeat-containing protein n=1 Tax=Sphingomonas sp. LHG3406-1 TaxID=2804617 RepID=UPI00263587AF|nr:DUF5801 repeats-in-toxin domain-containing protein [Sphingomonas sp. LHG3406-1]
MRYEDASLSGSFQSQGPIARDDAEQLAAGERGPATGNVISGAGTETGSAGADGAAAGARVVAVAGAGGNDTSFEGGRLRVEGEHGTLSLTARGDYSYTAKAGVPENSRDTFTYTLSDASGATSQARLLIEIGKTQAVVKADAQRVVPGPDGVVVLPAGVELSDIRIVGRDLLVMLPDGSQMLIVDGAVFVPQLVINDIEVPSTNLAALLIDQEPRPASGVPQSSGGNFIEAVGPLDPGTPLGDLLPPTRLDYTPPEFRDVSVLEDLEPEVGPNAVVQIDDDARPGGNAGGTGDDPDSVNATGTLSGSGGDGPLTFAFNTAGAPTGFTYSIDAQGALIVRQGETTVITVTLNAQTGAYTVTQNAPIVHAAGENENNVAFTFNYTVTDRDGDSAVGTLQVNVDDDTPTVAVSAGADSGVLLTTDDADSRGEGSDSASSSANFGGVFSLAQSIGADGLGSAPGMSFALGTPGGASGLTQGGVAINLYLVGGKVVGSTATSAAGVNAGNTVFDVSVNGTGVVTLTQYGQIDHTNTDPNPTGSPFNDQLISLADGLVTLTASATITDRDGDSASSSASIQIGANLRFTDDGPSLSGVQAGAGVTLDETSAGTPAGFPISQTSASAVIVGAGLDYGADGQAASGAASYAISVVGNGSTPLQTAQGNFPITLVQTSANVITGTYDGGKVAFTVTINASGSLTVSQSVPLEHNVDGSTPAAFDDALNLSGLINATLVIKDFDGDTATASTGIGNLIVFKDDGPDSSLAVESDVPTLVLDETQPAGNDTDGAGAPGGLASVTVGFASNFAAVSYGADGAGSTAYSLVLTGSNVGSGMYALQGGDRSANDGDPVGRGAEILLSQNGNTITGSVGEVPYFTITIDPATGAVTFTQLQPVWNPEAGDSFDEAAMINMVENSLVVRQTVTDSDGDSDSSDVDVSKGVFLIQDDGPVARNDADSIAAGTYGPESGNVITGEGTAGGAGGSGADTQGRDGAQVLAIGHGEANDVSFNEEGNLVLAGQYGTLSMKADGSYTYVRNPGTPGGVSDSFTYALIDTDGDISEATLTINIGDLLPVTGENALVRSDDDVFGGNPGGVGDQADALNLTGTLAASGGDGPLAYSINSFAIFGVPSGMTASFVGPNQVNLVQFGNVVATITINPSTGAYAVTQVAPISHVPGSDENDLAVALNYTVTDQDGDTASGSLNIRFNDDTPVAVSDSDVIAAGSYGPALGNVITGEGTVAGAAGADSPGADGGSVVAVTGFGGSADSSFDDEGNLVVNGQYGTLTIKADGSYSYARAQGTPGGVTDSFTYTLRDGDGDATTAQLVINIGNNTPRIDAPNVDSPGTLVNEKGLSGTRGAGESEGSGEEAAPGGNGDTSESTSGIISIGQGDGPSTVTIAGVVVQPFDPLNPQVIDTGKGLLTITSYSPTAIGYTYTLKDNSLVNGALDSDVIPVTITDQDGSSASDTLTIAIVDDVPTARNDVDVIASGTFGPESGNVISGAGTFSGIAGKDTLGADNAAVVGIKAGVDAAAFEGNLGAGIQGQYGKLTLNADGSYTYTRDANTPGGVTDSFSYTLRDADGDSSVARLDIVIQDAPVTVDIPQAGGATTTVYEAALPARGGEPEGSGEEAAAGANGDAREAVSGAITFTAPDGIGSFSLNGVLLSTGDVNKVVADNATGTLTVTSITFNAATQQWSVNYTYLLKDNTAGAVPPASGNTSQSFAFVINDSDGDTSGGNLVISIVDDVPTARLDTDSVVEGASTGGNVIFGTGTDSGLAGKDTLGADGAVVVGVKTGGDTSSAANANVGTQINGQYGKLTLNADGSYTYVANPNSVAAGQQDVFTYTIRDSDGDLSTTTLTITVNDVTLTPDTEVNSVNEAALDLVKDPADLAAGTVIGSNPSSGAETVSGQLSVSGATSYVLNGPAAGANGILQLNSNGSYTYTLTSPFSTNPAGNDGAVASGSNVFTYTATDANGNSVQGTITINIVDDVPTARVDNDVIAAGTFGPEGGNVITGAGTVGGSGGIGADTRGADGASVVGIKAGTDNGAIATGVGQVIAGQYGTLTIAADGTYSYIRNPNTPGDVTDTFSYTLRDGDGDTSVAQLNIYIQDSPVTIDIPPAGGATTTVWEEALGARGANESQGSVEGAAAGANDDPREAVSGIISFVSKDGLQAISINGVNVVLGGTFPQTITNANGQLLVVTGVSYNAATGNGAVSYTYTLLDNSIGNQAVAGGDTQASFPVVITDKDGDTSPAGNLVITIKDDAPTANNDAYEIVEGDADNSISFDVDLNDVAGADGTGSRPFTSLTGTYGTLTLNPDGTQTYTLSAAGQLAINALAPGATLTDNFSYTLNDGDGDSDPATVVVTLRGTDDPPVITDLTPKVSGGDAVVDEDDLPNGSDTTKESLTTTGDFKIAAPDGIDDLTVGGVAVIVNGVFQNGASGTTPLGNTITFTGYNPATGVVSYSYTLLANEAHASGAGENNLFDDLAVTLTDSDQDVATDTLSVRIIDDVPTANDDLGYEIFEGDADNAISFDVDLNDVPGADGTASRTFTSLTSTYGTLTLNPDGTQTYTLSPAGQAAINGLAPGATLTDSFSYTLTDNDGDSDPANVLVTLRGTDDPPVITDLTPAVNGGDAVVDEDDLTSGSDTVKESLTTIGDFKISAPDGVDDLTVGGVAVIVNGVFQNGASGTTPLGNIITFTGYNAQTGVVTYGYTLLANEAHASAAGENNLFDNLSVTLTDTDQDVATDTLSVRIIDDVPTAANDTFGQVAENQPFSFSVFGNDVFGADGVNTADASKVTFTQPAQGSVSYNPANGQFTFTPAAGQQGSTSFTYTIEDGDGDKSTATVTINLQPDSVPIVSNAAAKVDDDGLAGGNPGGTGDIDANAGDAGPNTSEAVFSGNIAVNWGGDAAGSSITFANLNGQPGTVGVEAVTYQWDSSNGTLSAVSARGTIFQVVVSPSTGNYTVSLLKPILHAAGANETSTFVDLNYRAQDGDGDIDLTGKLTIEFNDDSPNPFTPGSVTTTNGDTPPVQGNLNLSIGADGFGSLVFSPTLNGQVVKDGAATLTIAGQPLIYTVNGSTLTAATAGGQVGFVVQLNTNGTYTFDVQNVISNGTETNFTNLTGTKAGNLSYVGIGAGDTSGNIDVLLSASGPNNAIKTVNTDSDSIGVGNQSIGVGDSLRIDFVKDINLNAGKPSGFSYADHVGTDRFIQTIKQVQGNQTETVTIQVYARDTTNTDAAAPDSSPINGLGDSSKVDITAVRVIDYQSGTSTASVTLNGVGVPTTVGFGVTATLQSDGSVIFAGLQEGDRYEISTGNNQFDSVVVRGLAGGFDLGIFGIGSFNSGTPILQNLPIIAIDADGDQVTSSISATINPVGTPVPTLAASSFSLLSTSSSPTGDPSLSGLRTSSANNNIALMAGLAAGFAAMPAAASTVAGAPLAGVETDFTSHSGGEHRGYAELFDDGNIAKLTDLSALGDDNGFVFGGADLGGRGVQQVGGNEIGQLAVDQGGSGADPVFALDQGTNLAVPAAQPFIAIGGGEIVLPTAEQMMALAGPAAEPIQHNPALEQVLYDSLSGGGVDGIGIDRLIDAAVKMAEPLDQQAGRDIADLATGAGGGEANIPQLATQLADAVPGWDGGHFSALFQGPVAVMDAPTLHPDAVQPVANG